MSVSANIISGEGDASSFPSNLRIRESGLLAGKDGDKTSPVSLRIRYSEIASRDYTQSRDVIKEVVPTKIHSQDSTSSTDLGTIILFANVTSKDSDHVPSPASLWYIPVKPVSQDGTVSAYSPTSLEVDKKVEELGDRLPPWMPKKNSTNEDLLAPPIGEVLNINEDIQAVFRGTKPQFAQTEELIDELAKLVDVEQTTNNQEIFRAKTMLGFAINTSQGTVPQVLKEMAALLDVRIDQITYKDVEQFGVSQYIIPRDVVVDSDITKEEFTDIFRQFVAAGHNIEIILQGTYEHRSLEAYEADINIPERGHNGLNSDKTVDPVGGVYSTLVITQNE